MGRLISHDLEKAVCKLEDAQMSLYWSEETRGVLGLAAVGPQPGSRIGPPVPSIELNGVTAVVACTPEAVALWQSEPWS